MCSASGVAIAVVAHVTYSAPFRPFHPEPSMVKYRAASASAEAPKITNKRDEVLNAGWA
jgi:hypothetical protein